MITSYLSIELLSGDDAVVDDISERGWDGVLLSVDMEGDFGELEGDGFDCGETVLCIAARMRAEVDVRRLARREGYFIGFRVIE